MAETDKTICGKSFALVNALIITIIIFHYDDDHSAFCNSAEQDKGWRSRRILSNTWPKRTRDDH